MCYNIIDGRIHTECGHFSSLSTHLRDCQAENCIFSSRHMHPTGCRHTTCIRVMGRPVHNPIRKSSSRCPACLEGTLGVHAAVTLST